jgi:SAM-dependent methyltransferase
MPNYPACPACGSTESEEIASHDVRTAVRHFEVGYGFEDRGGKLRAYLEKLWDGDSVEVRRCESCGFGYAWPHRAGDGDFYNLVTGEEPEYPQERWEFGRTADALAARALDRPLRVLEAGAGDGAFLTLLSFRRSGEHALEATALEYDRGALSALRKRGFEAHEESIEEHAADPANHGRYDAVCMFQTLEHMDRPLAARDAIVQLVAEGGRVFVSVPNAAAIEAQERLTGFWDMPPNHVGRWCRTAVDAWVSGTPLEVVEDGLEPASEDERVAAYANSKLMAARYSPVALPSLAHRLRHPIAIDVLTRRRRSRYEEEGRELAAELPPPTYWVHLVRRP